jgi:hypothetical protein
MPVLHERRKFVRYKLPYGMLYVFDHYSARVGWVRDVGMGGLSFEINHESKPEGISEVIDVFAYDQELFYLPAVPCQKTFWLNKGKRRSCSAHLNQTCCGHHFVSLTPEQKTKWQELIHKLSKYSVLLATFYEPFTSGERAYNSRMR